MGIALSRGAVESFVHHPPVGPPRDPLELIGTMSRHGRDAWVSILAHLDHESLANVRATCRTFRELADDGVLYGEGDRFGAAVDARAWRQRANMLTAPQQRRLRSLCRAHRSGGYGEIKKALNSLLPQDFLSFPPWSRQHARAMPSALADVETKASRMLSDTYRSRSKVELFRMKVETAKELARPLGLDVTQVTSQHFDSFCLATIDESLNGLRRRAEGAGDGGAYNLLSPSRVEHDLKASMAMIVHLSDAATRVSMRAKALEVGKLCRGLTSDHLALADAGAPANETQRRHVASLREGWRALPSAWPEDLLRD